MHDPWRGVRDPDAIARIRTASDLDLVVNQVWLGYGYHEKVVALPELAPKPRQQQHLPPLGFAAGYCAWNGSQERAQARAGEGSRGLSVSRRQGEDADAAASEGAAAETASTLYVASPTNLQRFAGRYVIVPDRRPNGYPLWKQIGGERWLFRGRTARWYLGGPKEKNVKFECSRGLLRSARSEEHEHTPDTTGGVWQTFTSGCWEEDASVSVGMRAPAGCCMSLRVFAPPCGPHDLSGSYDSSGEWANGFPVWRQRAGYYWLYSATDGRYYVGGTEKRVSLFQAATEGSDGLSFIRSASTHNGAGPEEVVGPWEIADFLGNSPRTGTVLQGEWRANKTISITPCSDAERLSELTELPFCTGD